MARESKSSGRRRPTARKSTKPPRLSARQLTTRVFRRLTKYEELSPLEEFAMFMGMAQVLEFGLKQLLARLFNYDLDRMERWTLGRTTHELKQSGLRPDYVALLEDFVGYRNYVAHEYLANTAMLRTVLGHDIGRLEHKYLERAVIKVEEAIVLYGWIEKHQLWVPGPGVVSNIESPPN